MIPRSRLPGLLLIAALTVSGAAWTDAPDETQTATAEAERSEPTDAGNDQAAPPAGEGPAETADDEQAATANEARSGEESADVFVPTEKVSEDLSVAFPVDI